MNPMCALRMPLVFRQTVAISPFAYFRRSLSISIVKENNSNVIQVPPKLPIDILKGVGASKKPMILAPPVKAKATPVKQAQKSISKPATTSNWGGMKLNEALGKVKSQGPKLYAKLLIHNFSFTVTPKDTVITHRMRDVKVGDVLHLDQIREVGSKDYTVRGHPLLPEGSVSVKATVMEHTEGAKKRARMRRQRKGRRALRTIKPLITVLRIQDISINC